MKKEDFKYTVKFDAVASFDKKKFKEAKAQKEAFASLSDLRSLLPDDETIKDNPDLLYVSFNAAVINLINANDHGMATDTALAVSKYFVDRHMNLDHSRWDVVGHIISQGFSTFGENKIVTETELVGTTEPFNLSLGTVVYKVVRPYVAETIEESANDEESYYYQSVCASWEVGFNEFDIVLGSKKISDAEIVSDPERIEELSQYLKINEGSGFTPDGTPVYCLIKGDARPLGCAFTNSPAAAVQGVLVPEVQEDKSDPKKANASTGEGEGEFKKLLEEVEELKKTLEDNKKELEKIQKASETQENENILQKDNNNSSQLNKNTVNINMKLKSAEDITPEFLQTAEASTELRTFIADKLSEAVKEHDAKVATLETEKKDVAASLDKANADLLEVQAKLDKLNKEVEAKEKQELFDARMEELSVAFEVNEAQTKAIASQIKDLDETAYADWKANFELFAAKKEEVKPKPEPEKGEETPDAKEALKTATASTTPPPNSQSPNDEDEVSKLVNTLKGAITIQ